MDRSPILVLSVLATILSGAVAPGHAMAEQPSASTHAQARHYRKGVEALRAGRVDRAEAAATAILNTQPQSATGRHLLGLVKVKRGDLAGAVAEFDKALAQDPQSVPAREERAVTLARLGKSEKARADLDALKSRAASCGKDCPPELRTAVSRVEAALAAGRPVSAREDRIGVARDTSPRQAAGGPL